MPDFLCTFWVSLEQWTRRKTNQPKGQLQAKEDDTCTFRWRTYLPRPCCAAAQIWRPANPLHDSNRACVTYDRSHVTYDRGVPEMCTSAMSSIGGRGEYLGYIPSATITATGGRFALITSPFERSQKRRPEISPITAKMPLH